MKKYWKCLLSVTPLMSLPMLCITSCNSQKAIESTIYVSDKSYLENDVVVDKIYNATSFTFTINVKENCYINEHSSYVRCGYKPSHAFNGRYITKTVEGNKHTYTVSKDIVEGEFVNIYVSLNKEWNVDVSETSTTDFNFYATPKAVNNENYLIGFKIADTKGLDITNSVITIGTTALSSDSYLTFEETIDDEIYTFIDIPSWKVNGDIKFKLVSGTATNTEILNRPEYTTYYMSKPVVGNDFYCYYQLADSSSYALDTDNAVVKVGETTLTPTTDYSFNESRLGYTYIKINGDKVNNTIKIDLPVVEIFNCYACQYYENPTVSVVGKSFKKAKDNYEFIVIPLNGKTIDWTNVDSYISVGDKQLHKGDALASGTFTVSIDETTGYEKVTIYKDDTIDNLYCHFITK